jgi:hypothetical protein
VGIPDGSIDGERSTLNRVTRNTRVFQSPGDQIEGELKPVEGYPNLMYLDYSQDGKTLRIWVDLASERIEKHGLIGPRFYWYHYWAKMQ